jgi:hypothetical protein
MDLARLAPLVAPARFLALDPDPGEAAVAGALAAAFGLADQSRPALTAYEGQTNFVHRATPERNGTGFIAPKP